MFLFKKRKADILSPMPMVVLEYTVPHTDNYRGYKKLKLATYNYSDAYKGIRDLGSNAIMAVTFSFVKIGGHTPLHILANNHLVGTVWPDSWEQYYKDIKAKKSRPRI